MSKTILIIDDDPDITQVLKATLKSRGYDVLTAPDGEDGLRLLESETPDLIILDLMMPRMSGLEVCKRLRQNPDTKDIPIIVISAIGEKTGKSEEFWKMGLGADDFISKPFDPMALLGRVEYLLRRKQYVSTKGENKGGDTGEGAAPAPKTSLKDATPREVVRCFVEAWNTRSFAEEYECLGEKMRGPLPKPEYVMRRQQAYGEESDSPHSQKVVKVVKEEISDDTAQVLIDREDTIRNRSNRRREEYTLKKTDDGWKITNVKVLPK